MSGLSYRDFTYPLNVFMHVLTMEEGEVTYLHYGLFESEDERIGAAQERSTALLFSKLPPPPARILDAGCGVGTTLARLTGAGYTALGITPDAKQVATIRERFGESVNVRCTRFEDLPSDTQFDLVVFQESAQYIAPSAIFGRSRELAPRIVVLDEFATRPFDQAGALHIFDAFLASADAAGFSVRENIDLSAAAAPTVAYFMKRIPAYREAIRRDLGLPDSQIDDLLRSGAAYLESYRAGDYTYRLLVFDRVENG